MQVDLESYPAIILLFGMRGCPACSDFLPVFREASQDHPDVPALAVDCGRQPDAADYFRVRVTPTTVLLRWGRAIRRLEGEGTRANAERLFAQAEDLIARDAVAWGSVNGIPGTFFRRR